MRKLPPLTPSAAACPSLTCHTAYLSVSWFLTQTLDCYTAYMLLAKGSESGGGRLSGLSRGHSSGSDSSASSRESGQAVRWSGGVGCDSSTSDHLQAPTRATKVDRWRHVHAWGKEGHTL